MSIRLIATDLDGTLLDSAKRLPPDFLRAVRILKARGVRFVIASGRQYYNLIRVFDSSVDEFFFISENGAIVFDGRRNVAAFEVPELEAPLAALRAVPSATPLLCGLKSAYFHSDDPEVERNAKMFYERCLYVDDLLQAAREDKICKIAVFDKEDAARNCLPVLEQFRDRCAVTLSGKLWVDLMSPGVNKGTALAEVQKQWHISAAETMAFGDYPNDCEMMDHVAYSYAMANAHPLLKERCRFSAPANDDDGVMRVLREKFGADFSENP